MHGCLHFVLYLSIAIGRYSSRDLGCGPADPRAPITARRAGAHVASLVRPSSGRGRTDRGGRGTRRLAPPAASCGPALVVVAAASHEIQHFAAFVPKPTADYTPRRGSQIPSGSVSTARRIFGIYFVLPPFHNIRCFSTSLSIRIYTYFSARFI